MMGRKRFRPRLFQAVTLNELVPQDHELRRLDGLVDLSFIRDECEEFYSETGQPSIDPVVIFKMLLLGYLYGIRSERRVARECSLNLAYRWYLGYDLDEKTPNHSVLSKARKRYAPRVFKRFFQRVLEECEKAGLVGWEVLHADSSLVKANASLRSIVRREELESGVGSDAYVDGLYEEDGEEKGEGEGGKKRRGKRAKRNAREVSRTDPDSALVKRRNQKAQLSYKQHFTVDEKNRVITAVQVTDGVGDEGSQVGKLLDEQRVQPKKFCADRGYGEAAVYEELHRRGIEAIIPERARRSSPAGRIPYTEFRYDEEQDVYICPEGKVLRRKLYDGRYDRYYYRPQRSDCRDCPIRDQCTSPGSVRVITRPRYQKAIEKAREQFDPEVYARRQVMAEWVLAEAKGCHGLRRAQFRGLQKMTIQCLMTASVQNLKRLLSASGPGQGLFTYFHALKGLWKALRALLLGSKAPLGLFLKERPIC